MKSSASKPSPRKKRSQASLLASYESSIWLTGGALALCVVMIVALLGGVLFKGLSTFWPEEIVRIETLDGRVYMGPVTRDETYRPDPDAVDDLNLVRSKFGVAELTDRSDLGRSLLRTGNYRLTQSHFEWVEHALVKEETNPEWAVVVERLEWGRFYGFPEAFVEVELIERRGADGRYKSDERLLAEADAAIEFSDGSHVGEPGYLVEQFQNGESIFLPVPIGKLEDPGSIRGVTWTTHGQEQALSLFAEHHGAVMEAWEKRRGLEKYDTGAVNKVQEAARLAMRDAEIELEDLRAERVERTELIKLAQANLAAKSAIHQEKSEWSESEFERIRGEIDAINKTNSRYRLLMSTAGEGSAPSAQLLMELDTIVRALPTNRMSWWEKFTVYCSRWVEFLWEDPREANSEGGVFPAIFGTILMTLIMAIMVVPFGVLAALYLGEYAKKGPVVSAVRIAVNNLAGVPSIVFGIFGLGFFCYTIGSSIDELFFRAELPNPTFGKGGLIWASLTLALLTLPVVIVATEEALSAVPNSAREGSYACGAGKWQTIRRIILPRAMPGIMTGMILAMARGAGEVAPLMLVGAVKLAPELPLDGNFPFVHLGNSFMHLGFHIFDVGFQSQNSEAAKPMVYTTTLVLITLILSFNFLAIGLRKRLARRFESSQI